MFVACVPPSKVSLSPLGLCLLVGIENIGLLGGAFHCEGREGVGLFLERALVRMLFVACVPLVLHVGKADQEFP